MHGGCVLIGAAEAVANEAMGVVKATLDALNRSIGRFSGEDGIS
jgi:Na+-translocating ferredoxin:NAD+ oxidoreductase RnfE subunit